MDDPGARRLAGWAGAASVVAFTAGVALCSLAGVDAPGTSDAVISQRLDDSPNQVAAGIGLPLLGVGSVLLLWFAAGLRRTLERLSGGDPLTHVIVPAAAMLGGLTITGVSLDTSSAITAFAADEFVPDPDTARVLGAAGLVVALAGLSGGAALVAATTRIAQQARAIPRWAGWASYVVAALCLTGFWNGGIASVALALWLVGCAIGILRSDTTPEAPGTLGVDQASMSDSAQTT